jgi:hypothetical protein
MPVKLRLLFSTALVLSMGACATPPKPAKLVEMRAAKLTDQAAAKPDEALYQAAVSAIERRDYALALDALQAARARTPDDPRVWNAMGVVYDKLGRFDLSARYYAQAQTFDPNSTVVAQNLAYSDVLQHKQVAPRALAQAAVEAPAETHVTAAAPVRKPAVAPQAVASAAPLADPARVVRYETGPAPVPREVMAPASAVRAPTRPLEQVRPLRVATVPEPVAQPVAPPKAVAKASEPPVAMRFAGLSEQLARWTRPAVKAEAPPVAKAAQAVASRVAVAAAPAPLPMKAQQPIRMARVAAAPKSLLHVPASVAETTAAPAARRVAAAAGPAPQPVKAQQPIRFAQVVAAPKSLLRAPTNVAQTPAAPVARTAPPVRLAVAAPPRPVLRAQAESASRRPAVARPAPAASNRITLAVAPRLSAPLVRRPITTAPITLARNSLPTASMLGRPLMVVNASGRRGGAEPVRLKLASRGWSAPIAVVRTGGVRPMSTIRYAQRNVVVARALARTLPYRVRLESCSSSCVGVTLFVGVDALRWASTRGAAATPRRRA